MIRWWRLLRVLRLWCVGQSPGHQLAPCKQNLFIADSPGPGPGPGGVTRETRHTGPRVTATQSLLSNGTSLCVSPAPGCWDFEGTGLSTPHWAQHRTGSHLTLTQTQAGEATFNYSDLARTVGAFSGVHPIMRVIMSKSQLCNILIIIMLM